MVKYQKRNFTMFLMIVFALLLCVSATFAWFTFRTNTITTLTLATVSLNNTIDIVSDLSAVQVQDTVVNSVTFSKPNSSINCYVRAKLNYYSLTNNLTDAQKGFMLDINFNAYTPTSDTGYTWTYRDGYYYLVDDDEGNILELTDTTEYTFVEDVVFKGPIGSFYTSADDPENLKINIVLQAIQSANLPSTTLASMEEYFDETFNTVNEFDGYIVEYVSNGGTDTMASIVTSKNSRITAPTAPTKFGYTFDGWYTDVELETAYNFNSIVTESFILYAKWS